VAKYGGLGLTAVTEEVQEGGAGMAHDLFIDVVGAAYEEIQGVSFKEKKPPKGRCEKRVLARLRQLLGKIP
jgi:hypothetical protein